MKDIRGIVFDLYGTLYDVHTVATLCEKYYPQRGREVSVVWRQKQLEYTWLRSLMNQYVNFERATEDALVFTCRYLGLEISTARKEALCEAYLRLSPFPEVPDALRELRARGLPLAILSNGSINSIDSVVRNSGLTESFAHLISVDDVQIFKPSRLVYELAERKLGLHRSEILFVSSNAWDVTGAAYYGYPTCWVNRGAGTFEEMDQRPAHEVTGVNMIAAQVLSA
ncbi:haloacid dehalogenase type II [Hydrogenophaga sp.]|jgi:2-haloacid dehalogenase|uniref:haloacid dehalogenase type II n=1 Tax=Hydrogenophaga sp. TaxID=1904254 RepID=UPI0025C3207C|nr:haloacid dehalogenase type II [Hydrogenophaga sp.]